MFKKFLNLYLQFLDYLNKIEKKIYTLLIDG